MVFIAPMLHNKPNITYLFCVRMCYNYQFHTTKTEKSLSGLVFHVNITGAVRQLKKSISTSVGPDNFDFNLFFIDITQRI